MARVFPAYCFPHRPNNGYWLWNFHPSRVLQENSTIEADPFVLFPMICRHIHGIRTSNIFYGGNPLNDTFTLILLQFSLVVVVTRIVGFLLKPLKQPKIVAEILGGIIIGPSVMRRNSWVASKMVPGNAEYVAGNIGVMGFMFFLFLYGVKMDTSLVRKAGKKHVHIALIGIIVPIIAAFAVALIMRKSMDTELAKISSIGGIASYLGITSFPVLYNVLKELNLLSSEVGRTALSTALVSDVLAMSAIVIFEAGKQGETGAKNAAWYLISFVISVVFVVICIRRAMEWIISKTPQGQPIDSSYVVAILLGVFVMAFLTDMFGISIANGSLWLGLAIPDGPPLGATMEEKTETILTEFLLPFSFIMIGSKTDVFEMSSVEWSNLAPLFFVALTGYLTKFFSTWIAAIYWRMPFKDGITLSLILSLRGQIELILFAHWMDKKMIQPPGFTLLVLMTTVLTATFTPLIGILYDPTRPYMVNKRRTIQHTPPDSELRIVLSILDRESISGLIRLLEVSSPTLSSPLSIFAVHLMELVGRTSPVFIDHEKQEVPPKYKCMHTINALNLYKESRNEVVKLHLFTSMTSKRTMYQDICKIALEHKAALIILPFHRGAVHSLEGTQVMGDGARTVNSHVLTHAPCSVGVLVDKSNMGNHIIGHSFRRSKNRFAVLFLGGADSREALVYADRMARNEEVSLSVLRFLSFNYQGDNEMEKKLDDGTLTWFWVKNEMNDRVEYKEVVVENGEETVAAIQAMNDGTYNLWIVGRTQGVNPVLLTGLSSWSENEELGLIGDLIASVDFDSSASVLVVQQQILRG